MILSSPEPLALHHQIDDFDCGKPSLNEWLVRHARQAQVSGSARTFVVVESNRVVGYFSLTVGQVDRLDAPERIRKGMGQYPLPVVILARLAVCKKNQGQGCAIGESVASLLALIILFSKTELAISADSFKGFDLYDSKIQFNVKKLKNHGNTLGSEGISPSVTV